MISRPRICPQRSGIFDLNIQISINLRVEEVIRRPGAVRTDIARGSQEERDAPMFFKLSTSRLTADWVIPRSAAAAVSFIELRPN